MVSGKETLGGVTEDVTDKTGMLTENRLQLAPHGRRQDRRCCGCCASPREMQLGEGCCDLTDYLGR